MLVSRWWLIGLLAVVAAAVAAPAEENVVVAVTRDETEIDYEDYIHEDDMTEDDLNALAEGVAKDVTTEGGDVHTLEVARGGFKKGAKVVGKAILTAGKKVIKVTGKALKVIGKGAKKGIKIAAKGIGKGVYKVAKGAAKGILKGAKLAGKGIVKATRVTKKYITKKGKKIWQSLKTQLKGELGQAGKKLLKAVGKQVLEVGVSIAVEALAPMVVEYVLQETQNKLCDCENFMCTCCAQPPGFEKGCLVLRVRPKLHFINAAVTYAGKELARVNISTTEGSQSCKRLEGLARFITACIEPIGIGEIPDGFRGCLTINVEPLQIQREMCIDFKGTFKNGTAKWVPVNELDEVELVVEGGEE